MILLRMIPWGAQFEHLQGRIIFGMNELVLTWVEETEMPETLCDGEHDWPLAHDRSRCVLTPAVSLQTSWPRWRARRRRPTSPLPRQFL